MSFLVGTSGWHYDHWRDRFYPPGLAKSRWLQFYAQFFPTVELNASFYRLPTEKAFANWRATAPPGFRFAVKASRTITHYRRLIDVAEPLANFFGRARILGDRLGPILYQLPPALHRDDERLDRFLALLPQDLQHAVEFRHPTWLVDEVFAILRKHDVAFCVVSMPNFACPVVATASFCYVRFHGSQAKYASCYTDEELEEWAARLRSLADGNRTVYAYFNNDAEAHAVHNAQTLNEKLGQPQTVPKPVQNV
ncbi:MAG: DUF72 domain-containing protein [Chloroflexi bacterium]|nr:DUF72 domain-containing protein [Chloroflexota bacterium]